MSLPKSSASGILPSLPRFLMNGTSLASSHFDQRHREYLPKRWNIEIQGPLSSTSGINVKTKEEVHIVYIHGRGHIVYYPNKKMGWDKNNRKIREKKIERLLAMQERAMQAQTINPFQHLMSNTTTNNNGSNINNNNDESEFDVADWGKEKKRMAPASKREKPKGKKHKESEEENDGLERDARKVLPRFPIDPFPEDYVVQKTTIQRDGKESIEYTMPTQEKRSIVKRYSKHVMYGSVTSRIAYDELDRPVLLKIECFMSDSLPETGKKRKPSTSSVPVIVVLASTVHSTDPEDKVTNKRSELSKIIAIIRSIDNTIITGSGSSYKHIVVNTNEGLVMLDRYFRADCRERIMPISPSVPKGKQQSKDDKKNKKSKALEVKEKDESPSDSDSNGEPKPRKTLQPDDEDYVGEDVSDMDKVKASLVTACALKPGTTIESTWRELKYVPRDPVPPTFQPVDAHESEENVSEVEEEEFEQENLDDEDDNEASKGDGIDIDSDHDVDRDSDDSE